MATKKKKKKAKKTATKAAKKVAKKIKKKVTKKAAKKTIKKAAKKSKAVKKVKKLSAKKATKKAAPKKAAKVKAVAKAKVAPKAPTATKIAVETTDLATLPTIGSTVPDLSLENSDGYSISLSELATKTPNLVLYFYPKDDTPGCTKEACDFRDNLNHIADKGATIVGVSPDSKESHHNFASKYSLNFPLLADPQHELAEKMGVWKNKQFMGNSYMGVERSTFLYKDGKLTQIWSPVKVEGHVTEIIEALENNA